MSTAAAAAIFLNLLVICTAMQFTPSASDEILRNIVQSDQHLIVGSSNALYRINPESLEAVGQLSLTDANRLLVADTGGSLNGNILSCDSNRCLLVETTNFANVSWQVEPPIIRRSGRKDAVGVFVLSSDGISEIMFGEIPNGQSPRRFIKGGLVNVDFLSSDPQNSVFLKSSEFGGDSNTESFNYFAQFTQNGFVYFVTSPVAGEVFPSVARFCQNDTGLSRDDSFNSHFEIKLECRGQPTDQDTGVITAATLVTTAPFTEPTILVSILRSTSTDEARVDICAFSVTEIDQIMERKFRDCINGVGLVGFSRVFGDVSLRQCPNTIPAEVQETLRICDLPGNLRQGLEIVNPLSTNPLISQPFNSTEHLTSFTTNVVEGFLFLFAGSSNSSLYQYHFPSVSNLTFIRNIPLAEVSGTNVTDVLPATNGEHIFAMTMNKLLAYPVDQCQSNTECVSCLTSNDPICGWCALSGECVRGSECGSQTDRNGIPRRVYVESEAACPSLVSLNPFRIHVQELQNEVPIILSTANIINSAAVNFRYQCVFSFAMAGSMDFLSEAVNQGGGNFRCISPRLNNIPSFLPMIDTVNATISLRPIETMTNIATLGAPLEYTNCSIHTNCGSCIAGGIDKCQWCPLNFTCISPLSNCPRSETTSNNACPAILPNPNTTNYLFHLGHQYSTSPLQILSRELDIFKNLEGAFFCQICTSESCSELITTSTASFDPTSNTVTCDINTISFDMVSLSLLTPFVDLTLQVRYNRFTIDNPSNVKVTAYECRYKGINCAQCLSLLPSFDCSYCGQEFNQPGSCTFNAGSTSWCPGMLQFIEIRQCDPPRIVDFEPKDGPTRGGTLVQITGNNLGTQRSDIQSISIGGVDCEIMSYEAGVGVTCETGSAQSVLVNDEIVINLDFRANSIMSEEVFRYLAPSLDNPPATPRQGPASGGTIITISGTHLDIGSQRQVLIRQQVCRLINFTGDTITCETPAGEADLNSLLEVQIDKLSLQSGGYNYVPDPTFQSITPQQSFMSGGTVFTVTGTNLDIVQEPRLLIFVTRNMVKRQAESMQEIEVQSEPCITSGSGEMQCMAPTLVGIKGIQLPAMSRIGLLMDGVSALLNLSTSIIVQPNPTINQFESVLGFGRGNPIELTITGSNFFFSSDDVSITITPCSVLPCSCSVLQVYSQNNSLRCEITDENDLPIDVDLAVNVTIGFFSAIAGFIRITSPLPVLSILVPTFVVILILCVVVFVILLVVLRRKPKLRNQHHDQLLMERLKSKDSNERLVKALINQLPACLLIPSSAIQMLDIILGQGQFGVVYKAEWNSANTNAGKRFIAIKVLKGMFSSADVQSMVSEVNQMQDLSHPNIMSLVGVCADFPQGPSIVMPYMANGSLLSYLRKQKKELFLDFDAENEKIIAAKKLLLRMCYQISLGMKYLSLQKIIHRDLAARNCMLDSEGNIKVADFGLSEDAYITGYFRQGKDDNVKLPFKWMAPESMTEGIFDEKTDVWSFGVTCWEVFSVGKIPYSGIHVLNLSKLLEEGLRLGLPSNAACSSVIFVIIQDCWKFLPKSRPTFEELCSSLEEKLQEVSEYMELEMTLASESTENIVSSFITVQAEAVESPASTQAEPSIGDPSDASILTESTDTALLTTCAPVQMVMNAAYGSISAALLAEEQVSILSTSAARAGSESDNVVSEGHSTGDHEDV